MGTARRSSAAPAARAHALPLLDASTFFIVNGDTLTDVDLAGLASAHRSAGALVTLALTPNREPRSTAACRLQADGRVTGFVPRGPAAVGSFHFVGVQIAEAEVFRALPPGVPRAVIGSGAPGTGNAGVYDELIRRQPGRVRGVVSETAFWDIGTVADYLATSLALADGPADRVVAGRDSVIDPSATVTRSILWDDVEVGAGVSPRRLHRHRRRARAGGAGVS